MSIFPVNFIIKGENIVKKCLLLILFVFIFILTGLLFSCKPSDKTPEVKKIDLKEYSHKYNPYEITRDKTYTFTNGLVAEKLIEYEYGEYKFLLFKDYFGSIILASGYKNIGDVLLTVSENGEEYPYPIENIKFTEFKNVLGHDGVVISYPEGANSKQIIYFSCDNNGIQPLALCNKSNYEVDITGDNINDLLSWRNNQIDIIYLHDGELYTIEVAGLINTEVLNKELSINAAGCHYDSENNKIYASGYKDNEYIEVEAFIENCILYYKY